MLYLTFGEPIAIGLDDEPSLYGDHAGSDELADIVKQSPVPVDTALSADELVDVIVAQAIFGVVAAGHVELGVDVVVAGGAKLVVVIDDGAADMKERDHFGHVGIDDERMDFARGLEDVHAFAGDPVVLEIAPGAADDVAVDGRGMTVAAEHAGTGDTEEIDPFTIDGVEQERAEPDVGGLRHPEAVVVGQGREGEVRDGQWGRHFGFWIWDFGFWISDYAIE